MAKVSLRIYDREIESLVDQGHLDEAIAHCHHILRTFPKRLATYRLLGKAYLELKRYAEAVDIFSRVLMAVPDDFVSHVGMSIIRDEEKKMDDAIWHMERAFETQPSNAAIQGELQRLYGRRDGMEPPKIRMTRGALAHMYVQGELYPQAIAEIRAVLAEYPERADMQVLLARAYFRGGQKADASDMCAQLLKGYQYSFDANCIMVDLLPATAGVAESTQVYRMRVGELDPYAMFSKGSVFLVQEVPDAAISLERLEYKEENDSAQSWAPSLGAGAGATAAAAVVASGVPDWLTADASSGDSSQPAAPASPSEEIPEFLRQAGWGTSTAPEQPTSIFDEEPASGALTPAEIPDWLKGQEPAAPQPEPQLEPAQTIEIPDWLSSNAQPSESAQADIPDWLKDSSQAPAAPAMDATAGWLNELDNKPAEPAKVESDLPDWLGGSDEKAAEPVNVRDWLSELDNKPAEPAKVESDLPDWLGGSDEKAAEPANVPDWLSGLDNKPAEPAQMDATAGWLNDLDQPPAEPAQIASDVPDWLAGLDEKPAEPANVPDWLSGLDDKPAEPAQMDSTAGWLNDLDQPPAQTASDIPDWLAGLDEKPAEPADIPDWLGGVDDGQKSAAPAATVESLGATSQEQDDAVAWLESLAAKHGAKPEELVTDPNKRSETPPEWVSQAQTLNQEPAAPERKPEIVEEALNIGEQFFAEFESASAAPPADATSDWLQTLAEEEEKGTQQAGVADDFPDWLTDSEPEPLRRADIPEWLKDAQPAAQEPADAYIIEEQAEPTAATALPNWLSGVDSDSAPQTGSQDTPESDLANWLNSLDDEPGLPFDAIPTPDSILFDAQAKPAEKTRAGSVVEKTDQPDWLDAVEAPSADEPDEWQAPAVKQAESLPEWLQEETVEEETDEDDTPPWQRRERWEAGEEQEPQVPTPTLPSDWHPLEEEPVAVKPVAVKPAAPKHEAPAEAPKPFVPPPPLPVVSPPVAAPQPQAAPPAKKKSNLPARKPQSEGANAVVALNQAKTELDRGDIPAALAHYGKLIKKGKHIEETIRDLTESIYRYPVEVGIWQTLGDAYMRANRLKEALEAYNKAEELIR